MQTSNSRVVLLAFLIPLIVCLSLSVVLNIYLIYTRRRQHQAIPTQSNKCLDKCLATQGKETESSSAITEPTTDLVMCSYESLAQRKEPTAEETVYQQLECPTYDEVRYIP